MKTVEIAKVKSIDFITDIICDLKLYCPNIVKRGKGRTVC